MITMAMVIMTMKIRDKIHAYLDYIHSEAPIFDAKGNIENSTSSSGEYESEESEEEAVEINKDMSNDGDEYIFLLEQALALNHVEINAHKASATEGLGVENDVEKVDIGQYSELVTTITSSGMHVSKFFGAPFR